jgi:hypothetical protein
MTKIPVVATVLAVGALFSASVVEAKGPGGGSHGGGPTADASPPGWSSPGERQGWDGASTPPGWDNGQRKGWGDSPVPPGFDNGNKKGWDTKVTPRPKKE